MAAVETITKGVRKLATPQSVQIGLPPGFKTMVLNVVYADGKVKTLKISKAVAEALIAYGFNYEG
jgi:copper chaperone CopZ